MLSLVAIAGCAASVGRAHAMGVGRGCSVRRGVPFEKFGFGRGECLSLYSGCAAMGVCAQSLASTGKGLAFN